MLRKLLCTLIVGLVLGVSAVSAEVRHLITVCAWRDVFITKYAARYPEPPTVKWQLGEGGEIVEVFVSPKDESWIKLVSSPDGSETCLVAIGSSGEPLPQQPSYASPLQ